MPSYLTTGTPVPFQQPDIYDFQLAAKIRSGAKLRPEEEELARCPTPALVEASYRLEHTMGAEIQAAEACLRALLPEAIQVYGDLLQSKHESVRLRAADRVLDRVLPKDPIRIQHSSAPEDRQIAGQAASDFHRLTNELVHQLKEAREHRVVDVTKSQYVHRGEAARPQPHSLIRPDNDSPPGSGTP